MDKMEHEKAIDYFFRMIEEGKLIVGSKIPSERDMAQKIGIGRNSTREAISILRGLGLVESRHGSGNYVAKDSGKSIQMIVRAMLALGTTSKQEIMEVRHALANATCYMLLEKGITKEDYLEFQQILGDMKRAKKEDFAKYDIAFHAKLMNCSGNMLFTTIMEPIGAMYIELVKETVENTDIQERETLVQIHASLIEGLVKKDKEACQAYLEKHYGNGI